MTRAFLCRAVLTAAFLAPALVAQSFTDVTAAAGLLADYAPSGSDNSTAIMVAGMAVGDYDGDGWEDIYWPGGAAQPSRLYRNNGDGTFTDVAKLAGVAIQVQTGGPLWLDIDDDGDLDLYLTTVGNTTSGVSMLAGGGGVPLIGSGGPTAQDPTPSGIEQYRNYLYVNNGDGTFTEAAEQAGLTHAGRWGSCFGDVDGDGLLDLVAMTWLPGTDRYNAHVYRNLGAGRFRDVTPQAMRDKTMWGFTPRVIDYDDDGDNDLLLGCDIVTNSLWRNDGGGVFTDVSALAGVDDIENAMGSTLADFDRDGDLDWFLTAIYSNPPLPYEGFGSSGNRLYVNNGDGTFSDGTDAAGVRDGGWGWGAQFVDLDHDTHLDIVHANGYYRTPVDFDQLEQFETDTLRVFHNDGAGVFTDIAASIGISDPHQGRGLVVFDYDHDGALDVLCANNDVGLRLYRGDPLGLGRWLWVELRGDSNAFGVGAKVTVSAPGMADQIDVVQCGNNFLSAGPIGAWFGLGGARNVTVSVAWASGATSSTPITTNQRVVIDHP